MKLLKLSAALIAAGLALPTLAAPPDAATLDKLLARMEKLEARNAELEKEVKALKAESEKIAQGLQSDRISENEPEITTRLKAVEKDTLDMKKAAKLLEGLDGIKAGATLSTVAQKASGLPAGTRDAGSHLTYRADATIELPLEAVGNTEHKLFAHFRMGQGLGLNAPFGNLGHFASAPNGLAFRASGSNPDDSVPVLAEAWYQASIPLPLGGFKDHSKERLELTFGKMDFFGFFDQNALAGDESKQFLNSVFVHSPLLDAGGDVGFDANGFQPGFVASYVNHANKSEPWRVSFGIFGAGERGANYQRSLSAPLLILQAEKQLRLFGGLPGNYRAYVWNRSRSADLLGHNARHTGIGLSIDQRVTDNTGVFVRYGKLIKGNAAFNQGLSLGAEIGGGAWGRGADAFGIAGSWLKASSAYRRVGGSGDLDGDGVADFSFAPRGAEKVAEIYYRYRLSSNFDLTPDVQWISRPAANPGAESVRVIGLRANVSF